MARFDFIVPPGTKSLLLPVFLNLSIVDTDVACGRGIAGQAYDDINKMYYRREGGDLTAITPATMTLGTWASGGFVLIDDTNAIGAYELGVPNACVAGGAWWVDIYIGFLTALLSEDIQIHIDLVRSITRGGRLHKTAAG